MKKSMYNWDQSQAFLIVHATSEVENLDPASCYLGSYFYLNSTLQTEKASFLDT